MESLADALVEALMHLARREYAAGDDNAEEYEEEDLNALGAITGHLHRGDPEARQALEAAVARALSSLPAGEEGRAEQYRTLLDDLLGD